MGESVASELARECRGEPCSEGERRAMPQPGELRRRVASGDTSGLALARRGTPTVRCRVSPGLPPNRNFGGRASLPPRQPKAGMGRSSHAAGASPAQSASETHRPVGLRACIRDMSIGCWLHRLCFW